MLFKKKFVLSTPLHKKFILNMIEKLGSKKKYIDKKGIDLSLYNLNQYSVMINNKKF